MTAIEIGAPRVAFGVRRAGALPVISPTDVSSYIRLDQCRRYLRLRLHQRARGTGFLRRAGVRAQEIQPLFSKAGSEFEATVVRAAAERSALIDLRDGRFPDEPHDNARVAAAAFDLAAGDATLLYQPRLEAVLGDWLVRGDADLIRLERDADGLLSVLVVDIKSSKAAKVEHRLQAAFYDRMLGAVLAEHGVDLAAQRFGILYRGLPYLPRQLDEEAFTKLQADGLRAAELFGVGDAYLELVEDGDAYRAEVGRLVTEPGSVAAAIADAPFDAVPFALEPKCDDCLYGEFCTKWAAERDDLSLVPDLGFQEKQTLHDVDVTTVRQLAELKTPAWDAARNRENLRVLLTPPETAAQVERLNRSRSVGPRLDELIHRARQVRRGQGDAVATLRDLPGKGYSSLPDCTPERHPNLVRVYLDAQFDFLANRVYLLGALVSGAAAGGEDPGRQRVVVRMAPEPPESDATERALLVEWAGGVLDAIAEVAQPDADGLRKAPIHLVLWSGDEQQVLLEALARHAETVFGATALFDFVTQLAGYDSPVVTLLADEIRAFKNYPMLTQTLQSVARFLRFDWRPFDTDFRARLFDGTGRLDPPGTNGSPRWYPRRPRFRTQIPLEYAYGAWQELPPPEPGKQDPFAPFSEVERDDLLRFEERRLEALAHVAGDLRPNPDTTKSSFDIPELGAFTDRARNLAHALQEFVMVERHVELAAWRRERNAAPEQRVLAGASLLGTYDPTAQEPGTAERNRWNQEQAERAASMLAAKQADEPDATRKSLPKAERDSVRWSCDRMRVRLELTADGAGISLGEALDLSALRAGERVLFLPRWTVDSRKPPAEQVRLAQTPKQLLMRGMRATLEAIETERNADGRAERATAVLVLDDRRTNESVRPFVYGGVPEPLRDGELYTIEPDPNSWSAYQEKNAVDLVAGGARNTLFDQLASAGRLLGGAREIDVAAQRRFRQGVDACRVAEGGEPLREATREYVETAGQAPLLLVQGPPGTGKSYSTAFALFAHIQAALAAGLSARVFVCANTHAAVDVLLDQCRAARDELGRWSRDHPDLFAEFFDRRLLAVPLYRIDPKPSLPLDVLPLLKEATKEKGSPLNIDVVRAVDACIVAATPGGIYDLSKKMSPTRGPVGDALVLDEASRMTLPQALLAARPLLPDAPIVVVGDHRQMQPIRKHNWEDEPHQTFRDYAVYRSLFDTLREGGVPMIRFDRSYRLHREMAECLREHIYAKDGIAFHSLSELVLRDGEDAIPYVRAALDPAHPIVVIVHGEAGSRQQNAFEGALIVPILEALLARGYDVQEGLGVVVPHRAQRAMLRDRLRQTLADDPEPERADAAVDTVERFQGGEREAIVISATESDPAYLLQAGDFLYDPSRLNVALSRAKRKLVLVAARSVFDLFSPDEEVFQNALLWKNLLRRTCTTLLWTGMVDGEPVEVWGNAIENA